MSMFDRVLWEEGMFLGPQHFQQWNRQHEHQVARRLHALACHDFGLTELVIDEQALIGGEFAVVRIAGVFDDGLAFACPDDDPLPAPRRLVDAVPPGTSEAEIAIALPRQRTGNLARKPDDAGRAQARYTRTPFTAVDETTGAVERDLPTGRKNLRLSVSGEPVDEDVTLRVAKVQRTGAGTFVLDPTFIPTCLYASASRALMNVLRRVYEISAAKRDGLRSRRGQIVGGAGQFSVIGAMNLLLEHTIASHLPAIAHLYHQAHVHPSDVYREVSRLAGALATFSMAERSVAPPPYDHVQPTVGFRALLKAVEDLQVEAVPDRCVAIPLVRGEMDVWTGRVGDDALFDTADFYLGVRCDAPADKIIKELPFKAKLTSPDLLADIRSRALLGLKLAYIAAAPLEIPQRGGMHYFRMQQDGKHWDAVRTTRILAGVVPAEFPELVLECYAIRRPK
jgi:type VI secretion system protein ImpJ